MEDENLTIADFNKVQWNYTTSDGCEYEVFFEVYKNGKRYLFYKSVEAEVDENGEVPVYVSEVYTDSAGNSKLLPVDPKLNEMLKQLFRYYMIRDYIYGSIATGKQKYIREE